MKPCPVCGKEPTFVFNNYSTVLCCDQNDTPHGHFVGVTERWNYNFGSIESLKQHRQKTCSRLIKRWNQMG